MMHPSPDRATRAGWRGTLVVLTLGLCIFGVATALDSWGFRTLLSRSLIDNPFRDWWWLLRLGGYWPTWLLLGAAVCAADRSARRGLFPIAATGLAGLVAEGLKLLIRRQRPIDSDGAYRFLAFAERTWDSSAFGLPSSHAAVAFAGAFALSRLWPRVGVVVVPWAIGCGLTRVSVGQHFLSDVAGGALVGWLACWAIAFAHAKWGGRAAGDRGGFGA